jgi:hypothetical protein
MIHHPLRPLHHQRGSNPPRIVGYECTEHGELFTATLAPSEPMRVISGGQYAAPPRVVENRSHSRRQIAAREGQQ